MLNKLQLCSPHIILLKGKMLKRCITDRGYRGWWGSHGVKRSKRGGFSSGGSMFDILQILAKLVSRTSRSQFYLECSHFASVFFFHIRICRGYRYIPLHLSQLLFLFWYIIAACVSSLGSGVWLSLSSNSNWFTSPVMYQYGFGVMIYGLSNTTLNPIMCYCTVQLSSYRGLVCYSTGTCISLKLLGESSPVPKHQRQMKWSHMHTTHKKQQKCIIINRFVLCVLGRQEWICDWLWQDTIG